MIKANRWAQTPDLLQKREFEIDRKIPELEPLIRKGCSIGSKDNFLRPFDEIRMVFMKEFFCQGQLFVLKLMTLSSIVSSVTIL